MENNLKDLGVVESTLFIPLLGRIYASEHVCDVLYDKEALLLKGKLPQEVILNNNQNQYTYMASATRSVNMDRCINDFLTRKPNGVVVELGVGLETTFSRCGNEKTKWYGIDLENVISYRKTLLPEGAYQKYIVADAFSEEWIKQVRAECGDVPIMVTASGLFYYFELNKVFRLFEMLSQYGDIEIIFDAVNKKGMNMMRKKWMKKVGHADAEMFFFVNNLDDLSEKINSNVKILSEPYYKHIQKKNLKLVTRISMKISDCFNMVKMIHINFNAERQK